ncbi:MAG: DUF2207 domain-containing protein [Patescibacteria group bacterium]
MSAKEWRFTDWASVFLVQTDGSVIVRETRTIEFKDSFTWVESYILKNRVRNITDVKVFDEHNTELTEPDAVITDEPDRVNIRLNFSAAYETKSWVFQYTIIGGVGFFEDHDELYWNVLPLDREVPVDAVTAQVVLPEAPPELANYKQTIYLGALGSTTESLDYTFPDDKTIAFHGSDIPAYDGFTIVSSWPKNIVQDPGTVRLEARFGDQAVTGNVYINGQSVNDQTPYAYQLLPADGPEKTISVTIKRFGYVAETKDVTVHRGTTQAYTFELQEAWWYRAGKYLFAIVAVGLWIFIFVAFWLYYRRWKRYGQDPQEKKTIIAQYEPPKNMRPSEMGTVIDEKVQTRDLTTMIVDFAVRGYLTITEIESGVIRKKKDYLLTKTGKAPIDLLAYERHMLDSLFSGVAEEKISDLQADFYLQIPKLRSLLYQDVAEKGYFEKPPDAVRRHYAWKPAVLMSFGFLAVIFASAIMPLLITLFLPLVFIGLIGLIFAFVMPKKTVLGAEAHWWTEGFKLYLSTAERFRLGAMTPETFEKYLPYAMVLGVEKKWANRFKDIVIQPPNWYHSSTGLTGAFVLTNFTDQLSSFSTAASSSLSHSPSSSSSGFSGGFSGGGGGGGGASAG